MPARIVLNIDDSSDDVLLLRLACTAAKVSFHFHSVDNGEKAIAYLKGLPPFTDRSQFPLPHLILLDLKMPGKSGFDVLEWIRAQHDLQDIPVAIFTSSAHALDRARALELGAQHYLVKPANYLDLQQLVRSLDDLLTYQGTWDRFVECPPRAD